MRTSSVKLKDIHSINYRVDASYHLSEGQEVKRTIHSCPYRLMPISKVCSEIFYGNRAKRVYVSKRKNGIPFLSSSDILQADLENVKLASRKYTPCIEQMSLKKGWTLISRSGTVGNCAFATAKHAQKLASEDVIRLVPNNILRQGMLFAYLASKYGHSLLTQGTFGAVIQHIEPDFIGSLPIPDFPADFQREVDDMIQESARLREQATDALNQAINLVNDFCCKPFEKTFGHKSSGMNIANIRDSYNLRFDAPVFINDGVTWLSEITRPTKRLGDCQIKTWYPGIFKRVYVKKGLPYIKGSALFLTNPFKSCDELSKTKTPQLDELWLRERMLLISCAGACGDVKLITKEYEEKNAIGSPDIIRLTSSDSLITTEYIFAYLQIPAIYEYMQSMKYGSVIERFDKYSVENITIVEPTVELSQKVTDIVRKYMDYTYRAFSLEEEAIAKVEQEIEKWNN